MLVMPVYIIALKIILLLELAFNVKRYVEVPIKNLVRH